MRIEARIFLGIASFLAVAAVVYLLGSYEEAGTVMLLLASAMGLIMGGYLAVQARRRQDPAAAGDEDDPGPGADATADDAYLPDASVWPFGLGLGLVLMLNGLALGPWAVLPGAGLAGASAVGYARQSRRRD